MRDSKKIIMELKNKNYLLKKWNIGSIYLYNNKNNFEVYKLIKISLYRKIELRITLLNEKNNKYITINQNDKNNEFVLLEEQREKSLFSSFKDILKYL